MSQLSRMFQDRSNFSQVGESYQVISAFSEIAHSTSVAINYNRKNTRSELAVGLQLAALDKEIFKSKSLTSNDMSFLKRVTKRLNKKRPLKLKK